MKPYSYAAQAVATIHKHGLARFPRAKRVLFLAEHHKLSESLAKAALLTWLKRLVDAQTRCPVLLKAPPEAEELGTYHVEIGELVEQLGVRVGLRVADRPRHLITAGATGAGKSVLLRRLVMALDAYGRKHGCPRSILVIDMKGDFIDIPEQLGRDRWDQYSVHEDFRTGLNSPGNLVPHDIWINQVAKILGARCDLVMATPGIAEMIRFSLRELNRSPARPLGWPSLPLVYEMCKTGAMPAFFSKGEYGRSALQRMAEVVNNSGELFNTFSGFDVVEHLIAPGKSAVLDLTALDPRIANIVIDIIVSQILYSRLYQRHTVDTTEFVLVIDEADPFCSVRSSSAYPEGYSPLALLMKQGREFGVMVCLGMTFLGFCSRFISANATYQCLFTQQDPDSIQEAVQTLQIPGCQTLMASLPTGTCVYKEAQGPFPHAMLMQADFVEPARIGRPATFDRHPFLPGKQIEDIPELKAAIEQLKAQHRTQAKTKSEGLSEDAHDLLHAACDHPWYPVARLWEKVGRKPSPEAQKKARIALHNKGMAEFDQIRVGKRNCLLVIPTTEGFETLQLQPRSYHGRGGIAHNHVSHWLAMWGKGQGYKTEIEALVPGTNHAADCLWSKDGILHAFEMVATCESNILSHLDACFIQSTAVTTVTLVAFQKSVLDDLRKIVTQERPLAPYLDRIRFVSAEQVLKEVF